MKKFALLVVVVCFFGFVASAANAMGVEEYFGTQFGAGEGVQGERIQLPADLNLAAGEFAFLDHVGSEVGRTKVRAGDPFVDGGREVMFTVIEGPFSGKVSGGYENGRYDVLTVFRGNPGNQAANYVTALAADRKVHLWIISGGEVVAKQSGNGRSFRGLQPRATSALLTPATAEVAEVVEVNGDPIAELLAGMSVVEVIEEAVDPESSLVELQDISDTNNGNPLLLMVMDAVANGRRLTDEERELLLAADEAMAAEEQPVRSLDVVVGGFNPIAPESTAPAGAIVEIAPTTVTPPVIGGSVKSTSGKLTYVDGSAKSFVEGYFTPKVNTRIASRPNITSEQVTLRPGHSIMIPAGGRITTSGGHIVEGDFIFLRNNAGGNATLTVATNSPYEIYEGQYYLAVFERELGGATREAALATIANGGVSTRVLNVTTDYMSWETSVSFK